MDGRGISYRRCRTRPPCTTAGGGSGGSSCLTYVSRSATVRAATRFTLTISATGEHHFYCIVRCEIIPDVLYYCTRRFVKHWKVRISASPRSPPSPARLPEQRRPLAAFPPSFFIANAHRRAGAAGGRPENSGRRIHEEGEESLDRTYAASRTNTCQALLLRDREVRISAVVGMYKSGEKSTVVEQGLFSYTKLSEQRWI